MNAIALQIFQLLGTYGPLIQSLITRIEGGETITLADVESTLSGIKTYDSYGIRKAGTPLTPTPATAVVDPPLLGESHSG